MADYTPGIILGNLWLEGAAIALALELICRNLYSPKQKRWTIRILKICMSVTMVAKSALFSTFFLDGMGNHRCQIVARLGDACYHLSCIFGGIILLMRVNVISPDSYKIHFIVFHVILIIFRITVGVADVVTVRVWPDNLTDQCHYKDRHQVGIAYTFVDLVIDIYVSIAIICILLHHIRKLHVANIRGNRSLYISVLLTSAARTVVLTILNLICTVYFFTANANTVAFLFLWPVTNIFFIILIGYDTDIAGAIRYLQQLFRRETQLDLQVNNLPPHTTTPNATATTTTIDTHTSATTSSRTMRQSRPFSQVTQSDKGSTKTLNVEEIADIESATSIDCHNNNIKST